jgi:hypothetical protein
MLPTLIWQWFVPLLFVLPARPAGGRMTYYVLRIFGQQAYQTGP